MSGRAYEGTELELFERALNWKRYFAARIAPYVTGDVLEVGAGIGGTTRVLCDGRQSSWVCLEPDPALAARIAAPGERGPLPVEPEVIVGTLADVEPRRRFDAILYIDVLEHIEDDRGELERARDHLAAGGVVVVLAPAFQFLFSEFDRAVGHFRRYDRRSLRAVVPHGLRAEALFYLDGVGMLTSLANRFVLRRSAPSAAQIAFWDRTVVPLSRLVDPVLRRSFGRSLVAVLRRAEEHS